MQSTIEFYRDPANPLAVAKTGGWHYPGSALSASSQQWFGAPADPLEIEQAYWIMTWNPNTPANGIYVGARLVWADSGPTNLEQIAMISRNAGGSPVVNSVNVTEELRAQSSTKQIIQQVQGDSSERGPLIYSSYIAIKWRSVASG